MTQSLKRRLFILQKTDVIVLQAICCKLLLFGGAHIVNDQGRLENPCWIQLENDATATPIHTFKIPDLPIGLQISHFDR